MLGLMVLVPARLPPTPERGRMGQVPLQPFAKRGKGGGKSALFKKSYDQFYN